MMAIVCEIAMNLWLSSRNRLFSIDGFALWFANDAYAVLPMVM